MGRVAALLLLAALGAGCGPQGPMGIVPGGPLWGRAEDGFPDDWSFSDGELLAAVETRGPWLRHSVTVLFAHHDGRLYLPSRNASRKRWIQNLLRDPRLRVRVGDRIFEGRAVRVTESLPGAPVERAFLRKYYGIEVGGARFLYGPPEPGDDRADVWLFRVDPLEPGA